MSPTHLDTRRLFFGLDASPQCPALVALQQQLALAAVPVPADNLHLTLLFLGAVAQERLPQLCQLGSEIAARHTGFTIELDSLGLFPQAKVAWVAPSEPPLSLLALEQALRADVLTLGLPLDARPYRPHLTLYRKARTLPPSAGFCSACITFPVGGFHLYESCSTPAGVQYRKLASWDFAVTGSEGSG